jgi:hypothetical protein
MLEDRNAPNGLGNSSPFAADDWFDLLHDSTLFANLLWNDYDPDGDTLSITRINGQTYTPGTQITLQDGDLIYGYLTVGQDGSFTFTPTLRYKGQVSFSYTISDGESESTAWVTINVFNNMPQLGDQEFSILHDRDLMGNLLSGAYDPDGDAIRITHINGQAISYGEPMSLPSGGSLTVWADGTFSYTPPPNFTGADSFSLTISDDLDSYTAMVNILVTNNAPYAYDASFSVLHDRELTGSLYGYDPDGDPITAQLVSGPTNGTLTLNPDGTFTYTPNTHYVGPDSFTYTWSDGIAASEPAMVRIDVYNHAPDAQDDSYRVLHDRTLQGNVKSNDSDEDVEDREHLTVRLISGPQHAKTNPDGSMAFQLREDGSFTYTPAAGYIGSDTFVYALSDGVEESLAEVSIYIYNEPPVVHTTQTYLVAPYGKYELADLTLIGFDPDGDELTVIITSGPQLGSIVEDSPGVYSYYNSSDYVGYDYFSYQLTDGVSVSPEVRVQVLTYSVEPGPGSFTDFPFMPGALYEGNNGRPDASSLQQGATNDCWLVAPMYALAKLRQNYLMSLLTDKGVQDGKRTYEVNLPGSRYDQTLLRLWGYESLPPIVVKIPDDDTRLQYNVNDNHLFARSNGDWAMVLEVAYAYHRHRLAYMALYRIGNFSNSPPPIPEPPTIEQARDRWLNHAGFATGAIESLTGNDVDTDMFWCTRNETTRDKLENALANNKIVVAGTYVSWFAPRADYRRYSLRAEHYYAVVAYNRQTDTVTLRDPHGAVTGPMGEPSEFIHLPLTTFTRLFAGIHYEM